MILGVYLDSGSYAPLEQSPSADCLQKLFVALPRNSQDASLCGEIAKATIASFPKGTTSMFEEIMKMA